MRIFQIVIPFHVHAVIGVAAHELNRFGHNIDTFRAVNGNAVFRFETKDAVHAARPNQMTPELAEPAESRSGFTGEIFTTFSGS